VSSNGGEPGCCGAEEGVFRRGPFASAYSQRCWRGQAEQLGWRLEQKTCARKERGKRRREGLRLCRVGGGEGWQGVLCEEATVCCVGPSKELSAPGGAE
jgi:hypothetical protein